MQATYLSGTVSTELSKLTAVKQIQIRACQFSGTLSSFLGLPFLSDFLASQNRLSGTIPDSDTSLNVSGTSSRMLFFQLDDNQVSGTIADYPEGSRRSAYRMQERKNNTITDAFFQLNRISGTFPLSILGPDLRNLFFFRNPISGSLPSGKLPVQTHSCNDVGGSKSDI